MTLLILYVFRNFIDSSINGIQFAASDRELHNDMVKRDQRWNRKIATYV